MAIRDTERKQAKTMGAARKLVGVIAASAMLIAAFGATSAQAGVGNTTFDFSFGSSGTGAGQFSAPLGIAVNQSTGDVYVSDPPLNRISKFDADGNFVLMWGEGVDQTTGGDVCPENPGDTCRAGGAGGVGGSLSDPQGIGVDSNTGDVYVQDVGNTRVQKFDENGNFILTWGKAVDSVTNGNICTAASAHLCKPGGSSGDASTSPVTPSAKGVFFGWSTAFRSPTLTVDSQGYIYVGETQSVPFHRVQKFDSTGHFVAQVAPDTSTLGTTISVADPAVNAAGDLYTSGFSIEHFPASAFTADGSALYDLTFGGVANHPRGIAVDPSNQYVFAIGSDCLTTPGVGPKETIQVSGILHVLEYRPSSEEEEVDCSIPAGEVKTYDTRSIAVSANHRLYMVRDGTQKEIRVYDTPVAEIPHVASQTATQITSNKALIKTDIAANLDVATFHVEYGARPCSEVPNPCASTAESSGIGASFLPRPETGVLTDLKPDTQYYYRVVASNGVGSEQGPDRSFHTFPEPVFDPTCTNNLARQQTRAAFLLDCRAYELVSAENQGGYDVESDLIPGQTPYAGFPQADGKALYGVHNGGIPNTGKPTNRGIDPYVATRDAEHQRWNTSYVGVPADAPSTSPFSSTVAGADSSLNSFAFDGSDICDPCFAGGSNGIPIRTPDGSLTQGMAGSIDVPFPESAGGVRKHFSADGSHFLFSSKQQFEPGGNSSGTDATVYDRNLDTNQTQVVSTDETGATIAAGTDVRALDVSEHGDRVLIGVLNHTDAAGNEYYDLYLHKGTNPNSTPIETGGTGALYAGMTKDGSQIHFTTRDNLADETSDTSADLFRATISGGVVTIERVSKNVAGIDNDDSCDPSANSYNSEDWNVVPGEPTDCSVVAIGGQGGVASDSGAIYFLSPEQLDGNGVAGSPNIFLAKPGEDPQFVSTLESSANEPLGAPEPTFTRSTGPFTTPASAAIDRADGSYYVYDLGNSTFFLGPKDASISKFDASGNLVAGFGSGGSVGGLGGDNGNGFIPLPPMPTSIAVDNNPAHVAPGFVDTYRDVFVLDSSTGFSAKSSIKRYDSSGNLEQTITPAFATGIFSGIAVDPISGNLYVSVYDQSLLPGGQVWVYQPDGLGGFAPGAPIALISVDAQPRGIAVDSNNKVYVVTSSGDVKVYNGGSSALLGTLPGSSPASAVAVDVGSYADTNDDLIYVDQGNKVVEYDSSGAATGRTFGGAGVVGGSIGLGADSSNLVVSNRNGGNVAVFEAKTESKPGYDHPLVINSVREAGTRHTADFQVTPSGDHAVFPSVQSQTGFDNGGRYELFRYDSAVDKLDCVSCNTTNQIPTTDASLSGNGLSIADDGRVFFNTGEPLVLRDTNGKLDAYEWKENPDGQGGKAELISSGQDRSDSGLLTVSADGKDAYFFTREVLATQDHNGTLMKLYDAREQGGFFIIPPQPSCKASDECHGPGTQAAPPAPLGTLKGTLGNVPEPPVCDVKSLSKSAKRFAKRAKAMRRRAAHAKGKRAKALRKKAHKFAKKVRGRSKATKRCRARIRRSK